MPYNHISGSDAEGNWRSNQKQEYYSDPQPNASSVNVVVDHLALANKAIGTMVFNSTSDTLYIWNGSTWIDCTP